MPRIVPFTRPSFCRSPVTQGFYPTDSDRVLGFLRCCVKSYWVQRYSAELLKLDTQHVHLLVSSAAPQRLCKCGVKLSTDPAHFLSCQSFRRGPVTHRHNGLTQCLARLVRRSGGSAYIEPSWLDQKRPDIHVTYADSRFLVDGSVAHPGAPSYCRTAAFTRLQASKTREARKSTKYQSLAAKEDSKFVPFVMESHGGYGLHAKQFLDEMIRQSKDHIQPSVIRFRDYATRALSVCLLNGNCFVLQIREWDGNIAAPS